MADALSPEAQEYGARTARRLLSGQHGNPPKRAFDESALSALCAVAFAAGQTAAGR